MLKIISMIIMSLGTYMMIEKAGCNKVTNKLGYYLPWLQLYLLL